MLRGRWCAIAFVLFGAMSIGAAQETADIMLGGEIVARVREKGSYESVQHRAAAVDEAINQVLASTDDPSTLDVSFEQVDGMWTVLLGGKSILSVYPAEAEANGMTPEMLGSIWVRKFRDSLPGASAVEVSDIGESEGGETVVVADEPAGETATGSDEPTTGAVTNTGAPVVEVLEVPTGSSAEADEVVVGQGARLLILETFNKARELPEDDYLVQRESMADDLFNDLVEIITEGEATGRIEAGGTASLPTPPADTGAAATGTATPPTSTTVETVTGGETEVDTGPATTTTTGGMAALEMSDEARQKILDRIPEDDPSYANVVQKVAIKAKFRAASVAYGNVRSSDPSAAAQAKEVLGAARKAFNDKQFDTSERYLDTGLRILGVTDWEQYIDSAMSDLGIGQ